MNTTQRHNNYYKEAIILLLVILTLVLIIILIPPDHVGGNSPLLKKSLLPLITPHNSKCLKSEQKCDIFSGKWVPHTKGPYYTNATRCVIDERQNCMESGRPDMEFLKWRWKPDKCELPLFNGAQFLELLRGKSIAFVGDSLARNQMQSLGCLLSTVTRSTNESDANGGRFTDWLYPDYKFRLVHFSSTHLVKARGGDAFSEIPIDLYLDEADVAWSAHIEKFDYVIISSGHWYGKKLMFHNKGKVIGCNKCKDENVADVTGFYGYQMALATAFRTILSSKNFKGKVFLRTISPTHYEVHKIKEGGFCPRKQPLMEPETEFNWFIGSFYMIQKEEFRVAKKEGEKRGLEFRLLDITDAMKLRPDGHPSNYGQKKRFSDCLHWCLPGPVDTWNEFLLHMLKMEEQGE